MYLESRRTFLKGAAFSVAGVAIAKGVFSAEAVAEDAKIAEGAKDVKTLTTYPPMSEWGSFKELDGDDWKRGGTGRKGVKSDSNPDGILEHEYMIIPTACSNCEASCGLTAWVDKKTLTVQKYMGNPLHSGSRGRNCAKGYATQSQMYDPDRIPFPLMRAPGTKRGEGHWVRTTWDHAMTKIGKKMHDTLKTGDELSKKSVMFHVGRPNENGFTGKVWHTLGTDAFNSHTNICSSGGRTPTIQWANDDRSSPDWANAKLLFLNSSHAADAGHYFQQSASFIADARKKGAKLVVMDPRMSNSAGMADLWIAAWPGTEPAIYLYLVNRMLQEGKVNEEFAKKWMNWEVTMDNKNFLKDLVKMKYIKKADMPTGNTFEDFIKLLTALYRDYTLDFTSKETHVPKDRLEKLYEYVIWAGTSISTYFWRAAAAGNRGGWMSGRTGFLMLALRGAIGPEGGTFFHHWHVISVAGKGGKSTVGQGKVKKVDVYNELSWPPEWPLSTYEMSFLLPHLLTDTEWQKKWQSKGLNVPTKLSVWIPRMYNPVWINPDGFRWIEVLKDESKMELTFNLSPTWSETNWYVDFILPVGLAGERHDQHSEATYPARWTSFRQPVLRVALEKSGWKPKNPNRATLEAHIKAGLGEIWEENEFWFDMAVNYIDPKGELSKVGIDVKKHWESKVNKGKPVTIAEWYDAAFGDNLPNLKDKVLGNKELGIKADPRYVGAAYPVYEYMRDHGTWTEETNIYNAQERTLKETATSYKTHGHTYSKAHSHIDKRTGVITAKDHSEDAWKYKDGMKPIGIEIEGEKHQGFATLDKKLDFFCEWLYEDWRWKDYSIPFYPRTDKEKESMVEILSHVNHKYMTETNDNGKKNAFALNTVWRLPYNIHTRSANSKHLMEISQNHDPIWISTKDAKDLDFKRGEAIRVRITDSVSGLDSGYFVAMAVPTEAVLPGTLACSHHGGRWKLKSQIDETNFVGQGEMVKESTTAKDLNSKDFLDENVENAGTDSRVIKNYGGKLGILGFGVPLADMSADGDMRKLTYYNKETGESLGGLNTKKPWQFPEYNKDYDNVWWDGLSGSWQNAVAPAHPDPISGMHCWHQKVLLEKAQPGDKIGDIQVNIENNLNTYRAWRDNLTRGLTSESKLRRPAHIKRPWVPLSEKAYKVTIKK